MSLTNEQMQELGGLISRLVDLSALESLAISNENVAHETRLYNEMKHVAARIRALGVPLYDIPDPDD